METSSSIAISSNDQLKTSNEELNESISQKTTMEPSENKSASIEEEEDDVVIGTDCESKDYDVNMDEDELLKDCDTDVNTKSSRLENTSETDVNMVQIVEETGNVDQIVKEISEPTNSKEVGDQKSSNNEESSSSVDLPSNNLELQDTSSSSNNEPVLKNKLDQCDSETELLIENSTEVSDINVDKDASFNYKNNDNACDGLGTNLTKDSVCSASLEEKEKVIDDLLTGTDKTSDDISTNSKFLHVEQHTTQTDESFDVGGEDPFAQTSDDIVMDLEEKDNDTEATDSVEAGFSNSGNEPTVNSSSIEMINNNAKDPELSNRSEKIDIVQEKSDVLPKINTITNSTSPMNVTSIKNDIAILKDLNVDKEKERKNLCYPQKTSKGSYPVRSMKTTKVRLKRKSSTEEDSNESDFEVDTEAIKRPKRSAAKKAESQIKTVLRNVEEEGDNVEEDEDMEEKEEEELQKADKDVNGVEVEEEEFQLCYLCKKVTNCQINILSYGQTNYFCNEECFSTFRDGPLLYKSTEKPSDSAEIVPPSTVIKEISSADIHSTPRLPFVRKCSQCKSVVTSNNEKVLSWETMDFCSEECLGEFQHALGSHCANCKGNVQSPSLGKYCVRFGYEIKQFCCATCLEEFKKGLKVCSFCQKDMSSGGEGFLAPVGDKGTFKDFCTPTCMEKYEQMSNNTVPPAQITICHVCSTQKLVEIEVYYEGNLNKLCSDICFNAYKFANKLVVDRCDMCSKYFDKEMHGDKFNIFYEGVPHNFCGKTCMNVYILAKRKIVPCNWCKVKKYNFDMIKRILNTGQELMMCSLNCLTLYQVSVNAVSAKKVRCDLCLSMAQAQFHLTMSDATIRNFCTYPCVMSFQQQYGKSPITIPPSDKDAPPIPMGSPVPVISSVTSLTNGQTTKQQISGKPTSLTISLNEPVTCRNKMTQTRPIMSSKYVSHQPSSVPVETQTDELKNQPVIIPIPVPIYVPCPMPMYSLPFPVPVPFPLPIPVPMFIPTTRNSIKGIMKELKRIEEKVPSDPFEAELLMMAEMVAADKKEQEVTSSESEIDNEPAADSRPNSDEEGEDFNSESVETSNTLIGEDIMQIAFKMATEMDEPASDLESQLPQSSILNQPETEHIEGTTENEESKNSSSEDSSKKKCKNSSAKTLKKSVSDSEPKKKKTKKNSEITTTNNSLPVEETKPDANMKLKFTFGVNAWNSWVMQKNDEIEKLSDTNKKLKLLKTDILQLTADELNFSLSMFVKEVQKPNGTSYAPDTIYYLCLGIQQYLYENGRIDNIFTDVYFESFTDSLDEIAKNFSELFNDHQYIVTRVEEEHLWECKQLGAHSPHVLLSTLMFFNTKYFNLTNADEHMLLSFSHIMKHWKRNNNASTTENAKAPGSRNVLLRYYPPQSVLDDPNCKKKKVYEQLEDDENPLRCPVKLYEFYLSKCPESVKTRNDVFYLQPERSCVPDSPVWYSTMALNRVPLEKMLNRVKMVKEINVALLLP